MSGLGETDAVGARKDLITLYAFDLYLEITAQDRSVVAVGRSGRKRGRCVSLRMWYAVILFSFSAC